ncbi:MAG: alpha/beta fold hydrolase [Cellulosilyticaceae bacterium]
MSKRKMLKGLIYILITLIFIVVVYLGIQAILCEKAVKLGRNRLKTYNAKIAKLSYGNMSYVDRGDGEVILSIHGIFGGYDQAFDTCEDLVNNYRIIAPSRFGYLGSDIQAGGTPTEQVKAYVELLNQLKIDKVYVLGTSAGGTTAIRFALDYPERIKGLILYCSAPPLTEKPDSYIKYAGPPAFLCNNFAMWLISPLFESIMGMESSTIYSMLPIENRKDGVKIDASITNPDMAKNYECYPIEELKVPTLILHAKDDKLARYEDMNKAVGRFPNCTFVSFEEGGHLMIGHTLEIQEALRKFIVLCNK